MISRCTPSRTEHVPESVPSHFHHRLDRAGVRFRRVAREELLRGRRRDERARRAAVGGRGRGIDFLRAVFFEEDKGRELPVKSSKFQVPGSRKPSGLRALPAVPAAFGTWNLELGILACAACYGASDSP